MCNFCLIRARRLKSDERLRPSFTSSVKIMRSSGIRETSFSSFCELCLFYLSDVYNPYPLCPPPVASMWLELIILTCPHLTSKGYLEHFHMWISEVNVDLICTWSIWRNCWKARGSLVEKTSAWKTERLPPLHRATYPRLFLGCCCGGLRWSLLGTSWGSVTREPGSCLSWFVLQQATLNFIRSRCFLFCFGKIGAT